jgi:hypothetical protein
MIKVVLFKGRPDPWLPTDHTGFNKTGYLTKDRVVIHPRRSRIVRTPLEKIQRRRHRIFTIPNHPYEAQIETFFTGM